MCLCSRSCVSLRILRTAPPGCPDGGASVPSAFRPRTPDKCIQKYKIIRNRRKTALIFSSRRRLPVPRKHPRCSGDSRRHFSREYFENPPMPPYTLRTRPSPSKRSDHRAAMSKPNPLLPAPAGGLSRPANPAAAPVRRRVRKIRSAPEPPRTHRPYLSETLSATGEGFPDRPFSYLYSSGLQKNAPAAAYGPRNDAFSAIRPRPPRPLAPSADAIRTNGQRLRKTASRASRTGHARRGKGVSHPRSDIAMR